nr:hypothetical protein CFP56_59439 [Quercus suber]
MGFDPFLVELEAGGHREEVAVLRGTLVEAGDRREKVGFDPFFLVFWLIVGVGFDPFLVELEVSGLCEEVAVLRGTLVEAGDHREEVGFDPFFLVFVDCGCGSMGFDLDRLGLSGFSF